MNPSAAAQIENLLAQLSSDEKLRLIARIAQNLTEERPRTPQCLHGVWKDKFPADMDLDAALKEIRGGWQEDMEAGTCG